MADGEHKRGSPEDPNVRSQGLSRAEQLVHRVLNFLFNRRDIVIDNELYLRRWFVTPRTWAKRLFLHCILRADEQRHLHDHPWDFASLMLKGGYREKMASTSPFLVLSSVSPFPECHASKAALESIQFRVVRPGQIVRNKAEHAHAVAPLNGPVWTLVQTGQARRNWGFFVEGGQWVDWREYLGLQGRPDHPEDQVPLAPRRGAEVHQ